MDHIELALLYLLLTLVGGWFWIKLLLKSILCDECADYIWVSCIILLYIWSNPILETGSVCNRRYFDQKKVNYASFQLLFCLDFGWVFYFWFFFFFGLLFLRVHYIIRIIRAKTTSNHIAAFRVQVPAASFIRLLIIKVAFLFKQLEWLDYLFTTKVFWNVYV